MIVYVSIFCVIIYKVLNFIYRGYVMIKTMLVDFNQDIISYYKLYIKSNQPKFKVVTSLSEASIEKFMDLLELTKPQLIIMDIRFFAFSSLKVIADISHRFKHIKVLLLGEPADTEYMKKAMEFGVMDYCYKPIKEREFSRCLEKAASIFEEIEANATYERQLLADYNNSTQLFKDRFLTNLVNGIISKEKEILDSLLYFNIKIEKPYTVFVLRIDHFKSVILNMEEKEKHMLIYRLYRYTQDYIDKYNIGFCFINSFNSIFCIMGGEYSQRDILDICDNIRQQIRNKMEVETTIGFGRSYESFMGISISSKEAEAALRYRYLLGYNTTIPIDFVEPKNNITYSYPRKKEQLLIYSAVTGEYTYASLLLSQIFDTLSEPLPDRLLTKIVMNIIISISRYASEQSMNIEARFREFFDFGDVLNLKSKAEALNYMNKSLEGFCNFVAEIRADRAKKMLQEVLEYLDTRYFEDNITLDKISYNYKTTPEFLQKLFYAKMRMNIKEYLSKIRIKHAKSIMDNEEIDEALLAARVGYSDVRHFRSIFRRYEKMLPIEYKMSKK